MRALSEYDGILFTCASSAERLLGQVREEWKKGVRLFSIGPKTTACLKMLGAEEVLEAEQASYEKLAELCKTTAMQ